MILSINSGIGSSAGLFDSSEPKICIEEERFTRTKGFMGFPTNALEYILRDIISIEDIEHIALCNLSDHCVSRETFYSYYEEAFKTGAKGKHFNIEYLKGQLIRSKSSSNREM